MFHRTTKTTPQVVILVWWFSLSNRKHSQTVSSFCELMTEQTALWSQNNVTCISSHLSFFFQFSRKQWYHMLKNKTKTTNPDLNPTVQSPKYPHEIEGKDVDKIGEPFLTTMVILMVQLSSSLVAASKQGVILGSFFAANAHLAGLQRLQGGEGDTETLCPHGWSTRL